MKYHPLAHIIVAIAGIMLARIGAGNNAPALAMACWINALAFGASRRRVIFMVPLLLMAFGVLSLFNLHELFGLDTRAVALQQIVQSWARLAAILGSIAFLILTVESEDLYAVLVAAKFRYPWLIVLLRPAFMVEQVRWRARQARAAAILELPRRGRFLRTITTLNVAFRRTILVSFLELDEVSVSLASRGFIEGTPGSSLIDPRLTARHIGVFLITGGLLTAALIV